MIDKETLRVIKDTMARKREDVSWEDCAGDFVKDILDQRIDEEDAAVALEPHIEAILKRIAEHY